MFSELNRRDLRAICLVFEQGGNPEANPRLPEIPRKKKIDFGRRMARNRIYGFVRVKRYPFYRIPMSR